MLLTFAGQNSKLSETHSRYVAIGSLNSLKNPVSCRTASFLSYSRLFINVQDRTHLSNEYQTICVYNLNYSKS